MRYLVTGRRKTDYMPIAKRFKGEGSARTFGKTLLELEIYDTLKQETIVFDSSKKSNEDIIEPV